MALTEKQERFCQDYIVDLNATQGAIRAGYSKRTAYSQGQRLLKNVEAKVRIEQLKASRNQKVELKAEQILSEVQKVAFAPIPLDGLKFSEKIKCLELLCRHMGLLDGSGAENKKEKEGSSDLIWRAIENIGIGSRGRQPQDS